MMPKKVIILWLIAFPSLFLGCVQVERKAPEKETFLLEVKPPEGREGTGNGILRVERFRAVSPFGKKNFVYRTDSLAFESDFYRVFLAPPPELIATGTAEWLEASGLFEAVLSSAGPLEPNLFLEGTITELYGDYRQAPKAVMEIQYSLYRYGESGVEMVLRRTYRQEQPVGSRSSAALAQGWNEALGNILRELEGDLRERSEKTR